MTKSSRYPRFSLHALLAIAGVVAACAVACVPKHQQIVNGGGAFMGAPLREVVDDGPFRLLFGGPKGDAPAAQTEVTLSFSRAVHPLSTVTDAPNIHPAIVRRHDNNSEVEGTWNWYGTTTAVFTPKKRFELATTFRVEVVPELHALDKSIIAKTEPFTFTTERPKLIRVSYQYDAEKDEHIVNTDFNQDISPKNALQAIRIQGRGVGGAGGSSSSVPIPFRVFEDKPSKSLTLKADVKVARTEDVKVSAALSLRGEEGPLGPVAEEILPLEDVGPLRLQLACTLPKGEQESVITLKPNVTTKCDLEKGSIQARFTKDVETKDVARHLVIAKPATANADELKYLEGSAIGQTTTSIDLHSLVGAEPGKKYRVTFKAGIKSTDKDRLATDHVFDFEVADSSPNITLRDISGTESVVESSRTTIPIFVRTMNVPSFDAVFARIDEANVIDFLFAPPTKTRDSTWVKALPRSTTKTVTVNAPKNEDGMDSVDVTTAAAGGGALAFATHATSKSAPDSSDVSDSVRILSVTDLGIATKWSPHGGLVWVTRLSTAEPVGGASISLRRVWSGGGAAGIQKPVATEAFLTTTDKEGIAIIPPQVVGTFLRASNEADDNLKSRTSASPLLIVKHGSDWTYARPPELDPSLLYAIGDVFVERGLYRPGETILAKGYFRMPSGNGLVNLAGKTAYVEAVDSEDRVFHSSIVTLDAFSSFSVEIPTTKTTHLGFGWVRTRLGKEPPPQARGKNSRGHYYSYGSHEWAARDRFTIDHFRTPEFKVAIKADHESYIRGEQQASIDASGMYLLGAPMTEVMVDLGVTHRSTSFKPVGLEHYNTTLGSDLAQAEGWEPKFPHSRISLDRKLDAKGHAIFPYPFPPGKSPLPESYSFDAGIEDVSHAFAMGDSTSVIVHPSNVYLGIAAPREDADYRVLIAGKNVRADLVAADISGERQSGIETKIELLREAVSPITGKPNGKEKPVATGQSCKLVTDAKKVVSCVLRLDQPGTHFLRASAVDSQKRAIAASQTFAVMPKDTKPPPPPPPVPPPPPPPPPQRVLTFEEDCALLKKPGSVQNLDLALDIQMRGANSYAVGETARACLRDEYGRPSKGLFTLEREGVLRRDPLYALGAKGMLLDIPITKALHPNVRMSLHQVQGRTSPNLHPASSVATQDVTIVAPSNTLKVLIEPSKTEYRPGDDAEIRIKVEDGEGRPSPSQVTIWAVDEGIHLLVPKRLPETERLFAEERRSDVIDSDTRDQIFFEHLGGYHTTKAPSLRMGATSVSPGSSVGRSVFRPTAFFLPNVLTAADGRATVKARLPDNLTTWKVFAVAATTGESFGGGESSFKTNKPLMLRPALPRFLRTGDRFDAMVVVDSLEHDPLEGVTLSMHATGVLAGKDATQTVTIPPEGHIPLRFPIEAHAVGAGKITFKVTTKSGFTDEVTLDEDVQPIATLETTMIDGDLPAAPSPIVVNEPLGDLSKARADMGGFDYRVSTTPLVGLAESMNELVEYPYGCTEQLTSRLVPLIRLRELARRLGVTLPANVDSSVRSSLASLTSHQREDGGFGFWRGSQKSEAWLTILALRTLYTAEAHGYVVSPTSVDRARTWLEKRTTPKNPDTDKKDKDKDEADKQLTMLDPGSRAMLEDLYASLNRPRLAELRALAAEQQLPLFAQALVARSLAKAAAGAAGGGGGDRDLAKRLLDQVAGRVQLSGARATFADEASLTQRLYLSSDTRTTAMVLRAFLAIDPKHPLVSKIVRGLLAMRQSDGRWQTTQSSAWALEALEDAQVLFQPPSPNKKTEAEVMFDGHSVARTSFNGLAAGESRSGSIAMSRLLAAPRAAVGFASDGERPLFFEGALRYARAEQPKTSTEHGIGVLRNMHLLSTPEQPLPSSSSPAYRVGDYVVVDVVLSTAAQRDLVVLDDPIPSGFEAVNQSFANQDRRAIVDDPSHRVTHRELRDDRVLTFFDALPSGVETTRYLLRAITSGTFTTPPTKVECMYAPDIFGRTATTTTTVIAR